MNLSVQIPVQISTSSSFQYIPRSGIAVLQDNSMFNFLRNHLTFPQGPCHWHILLTCISGNKSQTMEDECDFHYQPDVNSVLDCHN